VKTGAVTNYELAGWWKRAAAWLVDSIIVVFMLTPVYALFWGVLLVGPVNVQQTDLSANAGLLPARCSYNSFQPNCDSSSVYQISGSTMLLISIISMVITLLVISLYYGLTMRRSGAKNGQSWGKQLMNIRVIHQDNTQVDFVSACYRQVLIIYLLVNSLFSFITLFIFPVINYLYPVWDKNNQALHDKMARTQVVDSK
jgi:uncharacterized RDD family membrane protein YckC